MPFTKVAGAWYLSYSSPAVIKAFDNFWANRPGPDGVGIQDRFIAAWQYVARRFRDDTRFRTAIAPPIDSEGKPFANVVFAPHHYDLSTDLRFPYDGTREAVLAEIRRGADAGDRMTAPTWFGEWGAISKSSPEADRLVRDHLDAFDDLLCGWAWRHYTENLQNLSFLPLLGRPYAEAIAGIPARITSADNEFQMEFKPLPDGGETIIWAPPSFSTAVSTRLDPPKELATWCRDKSGMIHIHCPGGVNTCAVTISLASEPQ
ncbi:MAG: hypothetical protein AB1696_01425 [Planctomycetota bacterium]